MRWGLLCEREKQIQARPWQPRSPPAGQQRRWTTRSVSSSGSQHRKTTAATGERPRQPQGNALNCTLAQHKPVFLLPSLDPHLDPGAAFPSRCNSCSGRLRSASPGRAGARCARHRGGRCNCGTAPWRPCSTAPRGWGREPGCGEPQSATLASPQGPGDEGSHFHSIYLHLYLMGHQAPPCAVTWTSPRGTRDFIMSDQT